ncbi:hypothetical protein IFM89_017242 [Coptis chinensis]|uniref:Uncharacterized protein n=1 Tax=Coptis chinensis TaxID=261450 RepID=A0A835LMY2_9MAGN|nr:hypothetical protein IFM89_017242 [Coptis chinensis]
MAKSCKGLAMELVKCLSESDCVKECAGEKTPSISTECVGLRETYFNCKRGQEGEGYLKSSQSILLRGCAQLHMHVTNDKTTLLIPKGMIYNVGGLDRSEFGLGLGVSGSKYVGLVSREPLLACRKHCVRVLMIRPMKLLSDRLKLIIVAICIGLSRLVCYSEFEIRCLSQPTQDSAKSFTGVVLNEEFKEDANAFFLQQIEYLKATKTRTNYKAEPYDIEGPNLDSMEFSEVPDVEKTSSWQEKFPKRWVIVLLCFSAFLLCNMDRVNMSIAILPMSAEYNWNPATVGLIQSSFFWGYLLTQIAGDMAGLAPEGSQFDGSQYDSKMNDLEPSQGIYAYGFEKPSRYSKGNVPSRKGLDVIQQAQPNRKIATPPYDSIKMFYLG